ncbi:MAG: helix-turn-helix transcriptional regulator, partial [Magnetococcales bacterium]|nr:helix-turn-helix transcriptional regulator [Magnetococcales bacterium]
MSTEKSNHKVAFGDRWKIERERLRLTQQEFADIVGVSRKSIGKYEGGERQPTTEFLTKAAAAGVDISFILAGVRELPLSEANLTPEESVLVGHFRHCDENGQASIKRMAALEAKQPPPQAEPEVKNSRDKQFQVRDDDFFGTDFDNPTESSRYAELGTEKQFQVRSSKFSVGTWNSTTGVYPSHGTPQPPAAIVAPYFEVPRYDV